MGIGFDIHHLGGAFGRVLQDATPFPNRVASRPKSGMPATGPWELAIVYRGSV